MTGTWFRDDCNCDVVDASGDSCPLSRDTDAPDGLCDHCKAHRDTLDSLTAERRALRDKAMAVVRAEESYIEAHNGLAHPGEPHNRDLWNRMPGDVQIYDAVGDCSACAGRQYGAEYDQQIAITALRLALGVPLRPFEEGRK